MGVIGKQEYIDAIAAIKTDFESVAGIGSVFAKRQYFSSRDDFVKKLGHAIAGKKEIKYLEFGFLQFADTDEGFDDCPVAAITFNVHLFQEFRSEYDRGDGSDAETDFVGLILAIRHRVLHHRDIVINDDWEIVLDPISEPEFAQFGPDTFSDCKGFYTDLTLRALFYDRA